MLCATAGGSGSGAGACARPGEWAVEGCCRFGCRHVSGFPDSDPSPGVIPAMSERDGLKV